MFQAIVYTDAGSHRALLHRKLIRSLGGGSTECLSLLVFESRFTIILAWCERA